MAIPIKTEIRLDSSKASAGVSRFKTKIGGLKQSLGGMKGMIAGAFAFTGANALIQKLDRVGKLAQRFDLPATTIQKLDYAAQLAGTSVESMAKAMTKATLSGQDAGDGLSTMVRAFEDLGINVEDFNKLSPEEQLKTVADAFTNSSDRGEAYAAVLKILGTRAQEIIPALADLSSNMDDASTVSDEAVDAVQNFNDSLTSLKNSAMPALDPLIKGLTMIAELFMAVGSAVSGLTEAIGVALGGIPALISSIFTEGGGGVTAQIAKSIKAGVDEALKDAADATESHISKAASVFEEKPDALYDDTVTGAPFPKNRPELVQYGPEYGPEAADNAYEERQRIEDEKKESEASRGEKFNASIKGIQSPLDQLKEQRQGMNPFNVTASSLAAIGGGGKAVGSANPELKKLDKQIGLLEEQITILENMRDSDGATMK